jgi:hypothetical protein
VPETPAIRRMWPANLPDTAGARRIRPGHRRQAPLPEGHALPPIRLQVRKDCIDLAKALPVIIECFNQHSSDQLRGRTAAIHNMLQPRLSAALGGLFFLQGKSESYRLRKTPG